MPTNKDSLPYPDLSSSIEDCKDVLKVDFFNGSTLDVARKLLGTTLCRRFDDGEIIYAPIVEVEAYTEDDPACHAYRGLTNRTRVLFESPGYSYVYFIYGMYHCLNVVTEPAGTAGAVLIRALGQEGLDGPGKLCREWSIDKSLNAINMTSFESAIWLAKGKVLPDSKVETTERIGISKAKDRQWRYIVKNHPFVSGSRKSNKRGNRKKLRQTQ